MFNQIIKRTLESLVNELKEITESPVHVTEEHNLLAVIERIKILLENKGIPRLELLPVKHSDSVSSDEYNVVQTELSEYIRSMLDIIDEVKGRINDRANELSDHTIRIESLLKTVETQVTDLEAQVLQKTKLMSVHGQETKRIEFNRGNLDQLSLLQNNLLTRRLGYGVTFPLTNLKYEIITPSAQERIDGPSWESGIPTGYYPGRLIALPDRLISKRDNKIDYVTDGNVNTSWILQYINNVEMEPFKVKITGDMSIPIVRGRLRSTDKLNFMLFVINAVADNVTLMINGDIINPISEGVYIINKTQFGKVEILLEDTKPQTPLYRGGIFNRYFINPVITMLYNGENPQNWFNVSPDYHHANIEGIGKVRLSNDIAAETRNDIVVSEIELNNIQIRNLYTRWMGGTWTSNTIKTYSPIYSVECDLDAYGINTSEKDVSVEVSIDGAEWIELSPINVSEQKAYKELPIRLVLDEDLGENDRYLYVGKQNISAFLARITIKDSINNNNLIITDLIFKIKTQRDSVE